MPITIRQRWALVALLAIAAGGGALWWRWQSHTPATTAARSPIGVRLTIRPASGATPWVAMLTLANERAQQAAALASARPGQAADPAALAAVRIGIAPAGWLSRLSFAIVDGAADRPVASSAVSVLRGPDLLTAGLGPERAAIIMAAFAPAAGLQTGQRLRASVRLDEGVISSDVVVIPAASPLDQLIGAGRTAQQLADANGLVTAGDALVALDATSAWGYWFRGLGLETRNDRAGALQAYEAALTRLGARPGELEAPLDLYRRINRLR